MSRKQQKQQLKLIVIHQYSPSNIQHFLNPFRKNAYKPTIYSRKEKRRYLDNIHQLISGQNTNFQRQCCHLVYQEKHTLNQSPKNVNKSNLSIGSILRKKEDNCLKKICICSRRQVNAAKFMKQQEGKGQGLDMKKQNKVKLPNLKEFEDIQLTQSQSKHKIYGGKDQKIPNNIFKEDSFSLASFAQNKQAQQPKKSQQLEIKKRYLSSRNREPESIEQSVRSFQTSIKSKRYQSQPISQDKQQRNKFIGNTKISHSQTKSQSVSQQISSFTLKNQSSNTVFQKIKSLAQNPPPQNRSKGVSKAYSILSNGLFKIPQQDEYEGYLMNYKPMNPSFNLKELIKQPNFHIIPTENHVYFGQVVDRQKNGQGITVSQKQIYQGKYLSNLKVSGCQKNRDGKYNGQFLRGKRNGQGRFQWNNGQTFEGEWRQGKKNGFGVWKSPKGDLYEGEWRNNRQNGKGYYEYKGGSKYRGYFKQFLKHGKGEEEFANGDRYQGNYELGKPHGTGKYTWANGDSYQGEFEDGSREGKGKLKQTNGQVYVGQFKRDAKNGLGSQRCVDGSIYQGQFRNGQRYKGRLKNKDGSTSLINPN